MATAVPAVDRAAAVMAYLSVRPFESVSLSDISRGTEIHKATCAAILTTMVSHGLISRDDGRRYTLGPDLLRLSHSYSSQFLAFATGRQELWRLAERVELTCSATVVDGDDMVILDMFGDTQPTHLPQRIGRRIPLAPPVGTIFKAWGTPKEIDAWLDQMRHEFDGDRVSQLAVLAAIRSRGFSLGSEQDFHVELDAALRRLERDDHDDRGLAVAMMIVDKIRNYQSLAADDSEDEPVNYLVGPVFNHERRVVMSVNLFGKPGEIRRRDVARLGPELLATTAKITTSIGGVYPADLELQHAPAVRVAGTPRTRAHRADSSAST